MTTVTGTPETPEREPFIQLAQELIRRSYADEDATSLSQWLIAQAMKLGGKVPEDAVLTWMQSIDVYRELMEQRRQGKSATGLPWPWTSWSAIVDPIEPGMLALISAADGQGKSSYAETLAEYWARQGFKVVFLHFELNRDIMLDRRAARLTGIQRRNLKQAETLTDVEVAKVHEMLDALAQWQGTITYVHCPGWTADRSIQVINTLRSQDLCDVVIVDYLEKIRTSSGQVKTFGGNQFAAEADNVELFKNLGENIGIPVIMLAQMNKSGKGRDADEIDRSSIRGAGEKSEKSNVVALLHRKKEGPTYSQEVTVIFDKNTLGRTGTIKQWLIPERFLVTDLAPERTEKISSVLNRS